MPELAQSVWDVLRDHPMLSVGVLLAALLYVRLMGGGPT
jgi:hypothetical protein